MDGRIARLSLFFISKQKSRITDLVIRNIKWIDQSDNEAFCLWRNAKTL